MKKWLLILLLASPAWAAIGNPVQKCTNTSQTNGITSLGATSCVIPADSLSVAFVYSSNGTTDPGDTTTVSDGTNNYQKDLSFTQAGSNSGRVTWLSFYDAAGRTATITANFGSSNMAWIYIFTMSSAATTLWLDQTGSSGSAAGSDLAVTTSGNIAQADEVSFGGYGRGNNIAAPTTFPGANYTSLVSTTNATRTRGVLVQYRNGLTAGSTETSPGTLSATTGLARTIVTYKGAGAAPVTTNCTLSLMGAGPC